MLRPSLWGLLTLRLAQRHTPPPLAIATFRHSWSCRFYARSHKPAPGTNIEEEPLTEYCPGGYHPVALGDTFKDSRYTVVRKLGWGRYSTVWLAKDKMLNRHITLKILTHEISFGGIQIYELPVLQRINGSDDAHPGKAHISRMIDHFTHEGPNGSHTCLTFDVHGSSLYALQEALPPDFAFPVDLAKRVSRQVLLALDFVHQKSGVVHTDVKPASILVTLTDPERVIKEHLAGTQVKTRRINSRSPHKPRFIVQSQPIPLDVKRCIEDPNVIYKLSDFGMANFVLGSKYTLSCSTSLRPPEALLGLPWDTSVDIWQFGCIIYELCTGRWMFDPQESEDPKLNVDEKHIILIVTLLGPMPLDLIQQGPWSDRFYETATGKLTRITIFEAAMVTLQWLVDLRAPDSFSQDERLGLVDLLSRMVRIRPQERESANELYRHPWLQG